MTLMLTPPNRRVITFYSFKGGVGRTMTLANVAYRLANKHGLRVIAVDWDLEAPGLHRFFGLSPKDAASAHGVLDYFVAWRNALERRDSAPPDVSPWILPITDEKHAPRFGSLSLLIAGRMDEGYDSRLASLDWQDFYENGAGAAAVETLREQLVTRADVILIDSRTGFTDVGGICTIQVPDGVLLMTVPNQQSLEGVGHVARAIAKAPREARSGRDRARMWLAVSRVPLVEETYVAERWFAANEGWFEAGMADGLWLKEDHPEGLESHKLPHRGRWGFDEVVLNEAAKVDPSDPLVVANDQLAETLIRWLRGEPPLGLEVSRSSALRTDEPGDVQSLEAAVVDAERRGDILGMAVSLRKLAIKLIEGDRAEEAIRKAEQASGIFLSRGSRWEYTRTLWILAWALNAAKRPDEAVQTAMKALDLAHELGDLARVVMLLHQLAQSYLAKGSNEQAFDLLRKASDLVQTLAEPTSSFELLWLLGHSFVRAGHPQEGVESLRESARVAHLQGNAAREELAITYILELSDAGHDVADADALRARLAELQAGKSSPDDQAAPTSPSDPPPESPPTLTRTA
jgi:cellulose biosynthesis protein BcsQ